MCSTLNQTLLKCENPLSRIKPLERIYYFQWYVLILLWRAKGVQVFIHVCACEYNSFQSSTMGFCVSDKVRVKNTEHAQLKHAVCSV